MSISLKEHKGVCGSEQRKGEVFCGWRGEDEENQRIANETQNSRDGPDLCQQHRKVALERLWGASIG